MEKNLRLEGDKVYLTPMNLDDAEDFVRWRNSDFVMSRFLVREPFTVEGQINWIKNKVMTGEVVQFVAWDKDDNVKIGTTYLIGIDKENKKCEFGFLIGEEAYAGGGRGTEMARLTSDYALEHMDIHKVFARVMASNPASIRACEKGGFEEEGLFKDDIWIDGKPEDIVFLGKLKK